MSSLNSISNGASFELRRLLQSALSAAAAAARKRRAMKLKAVKPLTRKRAK